MLVKRLRSVPVCLVLVLCFLSVGVVQAAGIKERMLERLPAINALKAQGVLGENNAGYLDFIGKDRSGSDLVEAENNDRRQVYTAIGKQQGVAVEIVGKRRALQIKDLSPAGSWLQSDDGKWYKK